MAPSETDRLMARPQEFAGEPQAAAATTCWRNWHHKEITPHDGLVRADHPLLLAILDRTQSASSLRLLLRSPLGFVWRYAMRLRMSESGTDPLVLDALGMGDLVHMTLDVALQKLEAAGGLVKADEAQIAASVEEAAREVAGVWESERAVPPAMIWRRTLDDARLLTSRALTYVRARDAFIAQDADSVLSISTNFRSCAPILTYVNDRFETLLSSDGQPGFTALDPFHAERGETPCVAALDVAVADENGKASAEQQRDAEAEAVAEMCARLIGSEMILDRRSGANRVCQPGDIALLAPTRSDLWRYEEALGGRRPRHGKRSDGSRAPMNARSATGSRAATVRAEKTSCPSSAPRMPSSKPFWPSQDEGQPCRAFTCRRCESV